jgi:hypothetical protein
MYGRDEDLPCHKLMVDWLILFAFPHIKHTETVSFSGAIRTSTRDKWAPILETEYRERKFKDQSHGLDWAKETLELRQSQRVEE